MLNEAQLEVIGLLQEEAAEMIQELSKIRRSGTEYCRHGGDIPNHQFFKREFTDYLMLFDIARELGLFLEPFNAAEYMAAKEDKLKEWTNLPHYAIESISVKSLLTQ